MSTRPPLSVATVALLAILVLVSACSRSEPSSGAQPVPTPSVSLSSGQFDDRATSLCQEAETTVRPEGTLASALDSNAADVRLITPPEFLPAVEGQLADSINQYVAVCYFLATPPQSRVTIVGALETGETMTINSFD